MLRGEDTFRVECVNSISEDAIVSLMDLYQPLIGGAGVLLYLTLHAEAKHQRTQSAHKHLARIMNMSLEAIERTRCRLEEYNLLRTFVRSNANYDAYIYHLNTPLPSVDFIASDLFMDRYISLVGEKDSDEIISRLGGVGLSVDGFREITKPFRNMEIAHTEKHSRNVYSRVSPHYSFSQDDSDITFDYSSFLAHTSSLVFPIELRTEDNMALIGRLGTVFNIPPEEMTKIVRKCCAIDPPDFDRKRLRSLCTMYSSENNKPKNCKDIYAMAPVDFLSRYMNGRPVQLPDKKILEHLSVDLKFSNEVINVMIEYILRISDNRLTRSFVDTVASEWARDNVTTKEEAIAETKKQIGVKKTSRRQKVIDLPDYMREEKKKDAADPEKDDAIRQRLLERQKKVQGDKQ